MTLAEFSIKKYYTTLSFTILIIILGIASYFSMPVQLNPDIDPVIITVVTNYNGVGATEVSASINEIIEEEIGSVEGVKKISSTAMEGTSIVTVEFGYDKDVDNREYSLISSLINSSPINFRSFAHFPLTPLNTCIFSFVLDVIPFSRCFIKFNVS